MATRTLLSSEIGADAIDEIERLLRVLVSELAVITEALRLYSPVWILPRRALVDVELGGHLLRAGSRRGHVTRCSYDRR